MQAELKIPILDDVYKVVNSLQDEIIKLHKELIEIKSYLNSKTLSDEAELNKTEVAKILGYKNPISINNKVNSGAFPPPDKKVGYHPTWKIKTIKKYLKDTDQLWRLKEYEKQITNERIKK